MGRRVVILSWEYPPIVEGGLARHVRKLSEGLAAHGDTVHVITRGHPGDPPREVRAGVRVHRVPAPATPRDLDAFLAWFQDMNAHMVTAGTALAAHGTFDAVHGHDWLVAPAAAALARRLRAPWVTTIHATEYGRHQGWVGRHPQSHIHGVETWMARHAERVIVCSHYMRGHVADVFGIDEDRVAVIPNGIDPLDLRAAGDLVALRARHAAPDEKLVLLTGRLVYEKGFQLALDALPAVIRRVGRVRFLVAGAGTHQAELEAQARRLGLMDHGAFLGWIGDDRLHALYRIADLCVVPSLYEPFGLVALEAMASGCPCIVADTGGLREVVPNDDVGLRFRSRDPRSLAQMMTLVLANPAVRYRLVTEASRHVLRFDWADVARRTAAVYGELGRPGPRRLRPPAAARR
ncbi:MAG: glycogen synthase [Solirubrobacteraceae bacterium]|nr:glycogen synthase [Solirubrobacteraceae bacterium]